MYRRIELITQLNRRTFKNGLCGIVYDERVVDAWFDEVPSPRRRLNKNCRFYFTEHGWNIAGRAVVAACIASGQQYRVISVKEKSVDVFYKDEVQVAVRPRKSRRQCGAG